jgi:hypothetical protein
MICSGLNSPKGFFIYYRQNKSQALRVAREREREKIEGHVG